MKTLSVATFNRIEPAREIQDRLARADIKALIHDESKLERFWFMSKPEAAVHLEVEAPDYVRTRQLIATWDQQDGVLREAVRCPDCGSTRVEYPQITRKFLTPVVEAFLMLLHIIPREFYCLDCHFVWPKSKAPKREVDILGFPHNSKY